jgi:hypothetical protein
LATQNLWDLQQHAIQASRNVCGLKLAGLTDVSIQGLADTTSALQQAILTFRDSVTIAQGSAGRAAFDFAYFMLEVLQNDGVLVDGAGVISALQTVAASFPTGSFVAGVTTDLLSLAGTNFPLTGNGAIGGSAAPNQLGNLITPAFGLRTVFPF